MKAIYIDWDELQDYLDKYGDKIKFIISYQMAQSNANGGRKFCLVIVE